MNTLKSIFGMIVGLFGLQALVGAKNCHSGSSRSESPTMVSAMEMECQMQPISNEIQTYTPPTPTKYQSPKRERGIKLIAAPSLYSEGGQIKKVVFTTRSGNFRSARVIESDGGLLVLQRGGHQFFRRLGQI